MAEEMTSSSNGVRVCVTGGAGFIASWLVKKLLERGCTVHATLRSTGDEEKVGLLRRLVPGAAESGRLVLFEADLYDAATFAPAIEGCRFVFLCADSRTVKRVIHTGTISTCSPLKEDSTGFKDAVDESCWTPLDVDYPHRNLQFHEYILSKLLSEKELLAYNAVESPAFEVVTVPCPVVAGDTLQGRTTEGFGCAASPVTRDAPRFGALRMLLRLMGSVPLAHVDAVCDALVFSIEQPSMAGRFLCAAACPTVYDVVAHFAAKYPYLDLLTDDKLGELGFRYKYGMEEILDGSIDCTVRFGCLDAFNDPSLASKIDNKSS
ncbi:hypothetical protein U9M48_026778 [Paspalum notatum var. saurae]|uniref:NAD(P)-binding domain-containing protein n=1 Tax=Paspalum notatum var. saurae TaxID=547442 RepID=A0AAQ3WYM1_PASNO